MKLSRFLIAFLIMGAISFTSCKETESEEEETEISDETEVVSGQMETETEEEALLNIVEAASGIDDLATLVTAVKAADLVETLSGEGPFTVFAPTNTAFENLPDGTLETVLKPENKEMLQGILTYHVVAGSVKAEDLKKMITSNDGTATIKTVAGGELKAMIVDSKVIIEDANGGKATVVTANVEQSNGVVHVVDAVLLPKS